ncbi:RNA polymerase sigma factor [Sphingobacterium hotanense]|uniref:RNA polymerase sigma-70 factor n=1 Tax=Sphingobacterium hotanense TaxID=649196 RepID=A0ABT7NMC4_9SPHI|nr:RNA polymerase sigma-70 factor [Sphingobacterium hotanense]MDM1048321.1 RNA polymerase sigma-70 factor [Sphingobacterium hotanense]
MVKTYEPYNDEQTLLLRLKSGDYQAFTQLYQRYSLRLLGRIIRLVKSEETAEEILQTLFLKVWERRDQIDADKSLKPFLFTIAQNLVYDHFRRMALDERFRNEFIKQYAEDYQHIEEELTFKQTQENVMNAIKALPPQCQKVFILFKIEGKSYAEICETLNISKSTVNNHLTKANSLLKSNLPLYQYRLLTTFVLLWCQL